MPSLHTWLAFFIIAIAVIIITPIIVTHVVTSFPSPIIARIPIVKPTVVDARIISTRDTTPRISFHDAIHRTRRPPLASAIASGGGG